jgi:hypothetical protein
MFAEASDLVTLHKDKFRENAASVKMNRDWGDVLTDLVLTL